MRVAFVVASKELRQRLRDRSAIFVAFIAPSILATIVSFAFGSGFGDDGLIQIEATVIDSDSSAISEAFVRTLSSEELSELVVLRESSSEAEARKLVGDEKLDAAFVVPKGFGSDVIAGREADVGVITDAASSFRADIAQAIASGFAHQVNASRLSVFTAMRSGASTADQSELGAEAALLEIPINLVDSAVATREVSGANYFGPAMAMFFLFFSVGAGARSLFAEKEMGTLPRVLAAPSRRESVMAGKALATFVLGVASMVSVYVVMSLFFGVDWGDPVAVAILTLLTVAGLMMITAVVQTFARTEQSAAAYGSMVGVGLALAGGNFFPLFLLPDFMQQVATLTPNGWALRAFTEIAYDGATAVDLLPHFGALIAFAAICGGAAAYRARRIVLT